MNHISANDNPALTVCCTIPRGEVRLRDFASYRSTLMTDTAEHLDFVRRNRR